MYCISDLVFNFGRHMCEIQTSLYVQCHTITVWIVNICKDQQKRVNLNVIFRWTNQGPLTCQIITLELFQQPITTLVNLFALQEKVSKVRKRSAAVVGPLQEGYCYSKAYPNTELKLDPDLVRGSSLPFSRGPYHQLTRAKFRALE